MQLKLRVDKGDSVVDFDSSAANAELVETRKWQTLSLQQLNDLQSKLMLVAGKALEGKEQVDQFVEVGMFVCFELQGECSVTYVVAGL